MVLPERIYRAARDGDRDTVIAYLNAPAEAGGLPDVNEQSATGGTILMAAVCQIDSAARLAFVWELVGRGADLCSIIDHDYRDMTLASPSRRICSTLTPIVPSCEIISIGSRVRTFSLAFASMEAGRRINGHLTRAFSASGLCSYAVARKRPTDVSRASRTSPMGRAGRC